MDAMPPIFFFTSSSCNSTLFLYESSNHFFSPYSPYFTSLSNNNKNFIFFLVTSFVLFTFLTYTHPSSSRHTRAVVQKNTTHTIIAQQQTIFTPAYSTLIFSSSRYRFILNFTSPNDLLAIFFTAFLLLHTCKTDIHTQISHKPHSPPSTYDSVL